MNELEQVKKEKEGLDNKLTGFEYASKDLDNLLGSLRSDKNKEGLRYNAIPPPPPAQVYSPPKKDFSWTGLPEFVDNTVTGHSRPTPSIDASKCNTSDLQSSNFSVSEHGESSGSIMSKPMIKFVKADDCPRVIKTNNTENARKSTVKYAEMYRNTSKSPKVRGKTWPKNNFAHKSMTPRAVLLKPGITPIAVSRPNMNIAQPKMTSFAKTTHSNIKRPFQGKSTVRTQPRVPRVSNVTKKFPTVDSKFPTAKSTLLLIWKTREKLLRPQLVGFRDLNKTLLKKYEPYDEGYVSFGHGCGKITSKGIIKTSKLEFENVYFVKELKYNLFSVSQVYDNKNSVLFIDSECIVLGKDFKLKDDTNVLLRTLKQHNMYSIDLNNIVPHKNLTCLVAKASVDESMLWHRRLGHLNFKTMNKLVKNNLVKGLPSKCFENDHTCVACQKGKQHKASCKTKLVNFVSKPLHTLHMNLFGPTSISSLNHKWYCLVVTNDFSRFTWTYFLRTKDEISSILRNFITEIENLKDLKVKIIRTPQRNGVAERRNRTLIEAARTMLADAKLPITFWAEAVNTACYVQNRVLTTWGSLMLKGMKVILLVVVAGTSSTNISCTKDVANQDVQKDVSSLRYIALPNWFHEAHIKTRNSEAPDGCNVDVSKAVGSLIPLLLQKFPQLIKFEDTFGVEADLSNMETSLPVSPTPTFRIHKDHPKSQIIGPVDTPILTRHKSKDVEEQSFIATIHHKTNPDLLQFCLFSCFLSQEEPKKIFDALKDPSWEEGFDYEEVFAPVAMIEAVRQFLVYASFMGFIVYQMDVKSVFLYGTIDEAVYVMQPPGFQDPEGTIDQTLFIKKHKGEFLLVQVVMGELTFFLGLQVLQKKDGIFLLQDKYVGDILKKFGYSDIRSANTPIDKENPWGKDGHVKDVELYLYRSMIESLMYLTASRPDIMFVVCACARHQVTPKECHLYAVKRIFKYLKGHPKLGLWYPKESPFDLVAYSDSDYGGAT
uniref:Putative ribonuclease H-like domain-containing protein n=1 Tax=Tanacetum cinerariifolium TaxID=118510 RepID=A0A6L2KQH9_TANCI|nr:putative ribonuclease H-like domain-containing protein [Tanacetum cinerariifolium]